MGDLFLMCKVKSTNQLMEIGSSNIIFEMASTSYIIKQFSTFCEFDHNVGNFFNLAIFFMILLVLLHIDQFDNVLMVQLHHDIELVLQSLKIRSVYFFDNFDSDMFASLFIKRQFNPRMNYQKYLALYPEPSVFRNTKLLQVEYFFLLSMVLNIDYI